jgi:transcriptional regulator
VHHVVKTCEGDARLHRWRRAKAVALEIGFACILSHHTTREPVQFGDHWPQIFILSSNTSTAIVCQYVMAKTEVWQGTLALMILRTLETLGPLHGYGIARRIEQTSNSELAVLYGTIYPALVKLEQDGFITSEWGVSENNRRAKYYRLTRSGRKRLEKDAREWLRTTGIVSRFLKTDG